jgi:hypothetical protein
MPPLDIQSIASRKCPVKSFRDRTPAVELPFLGAEIAEGKFPCQKPSGALPPEGRGLLECHLTGGARAEPERARRAEAQKLAMRRAVLATVGSERSASSVWLDGKVSLISHL